MMAAQNDNKTQSDYDYLDDKRFYAVDWMEKCYQQLTAPNPYLEKLMEKIGNHLATNVKGQLDNSGKQQAVFTLLGRQYVREHFPHHRYDPSLLEPPKMSTEARVMAIEEMQAWLQKQLEVTCAELNYNKAPSESLQHPELGSFFRQAQAVYKAGLEKRLMEIRANEGKKKGKYPLLPHDSSSQALGEALLAIGLRDPFKMAQILKTLQQKSFPLPGVLRSFVWAEFLFLQEGIKPNVKQGSIGRDHFVKFRSTVDKHTKEMKLVRSINSPAQKIIDEAVMTVYDHFPALRVLDKEKHVMQASHILNILYVYNKSFNPTSVLWLCPLQLAFTDAEMDEDKHIISLAMHLDLLVRHCPLSSSDLFSVADQVMSSLKLMDPYLHEHLVDTTAKKVRVNTKDFPLECLHKDKTEGEKILNDVDKYIGKHIPPEHLTLFGNPSIFIRSWLIVAFANAFSPIALLMMWDFIFLGKWDQRRLHDICLVLIGLLKHWFYRANDHVSIRNVFLEEPAKLYTTDIRRAWAYWMEGGSFEAIPDMNRNIKTKTESVAGQIDIVPDKSINKVKIRRTSVKIQKTKKDTEEDEVSTAEEEDEPGLSLSLLPLSRERLSSPFREERTSWVAFNSDMKKTYPEATSFSHPFDIYIDAVKFVPDCATIIKVTGTIYNLDLGLKPSGKSEKLIPPEITAFPKISSSSRSSVFKYKITVNKEGKLPNPDAVLMLQVFTYQSLTKSVVLLGTAMIGIFDTSQKKPVLRVGGHQVRLRLGSPKLRRGSVPFIQLDALNNCPFVPAATLLIRLLPTSSANTSQQIISSLPESGKSTFLESLLPPLNQDYIEMPEYESGYYQSESCRPLVSEWRLIHHYFSDIERTLSIRQQALKLLWEDNYNGNPSDHDIAAWIPTKLENKNPDVQFLDMLHFVKYDVESGVAIQVKRVYGLPEYQDGHYIQTLVRILPGQTSNRRYQSPQFGMDEKFLTHILNFNSRMRCPRWADKSQVLYPYYDEYSILLLEVYGVQVKYIRDATGRSYGTILPKDGTEMEINFDNPLCWGILAVFDKGSVNSGIHTVPLLKGKLTGNIAEMFKVNPVPKVLESVQRTEAIRPHENAFIEVALWDGNFTDDEHPPLIKSDALMKTLGIKPTFSISRSGARLYQLVLDAFSQAESASGTSGEAYKREKALFEELMLRKFISLMNAALIKEGLMPLAQ